MGLNEICYGLNSEEREIVLQRNRIAANDEMARIEYQKERNKILRKSEIERILKNCGDRFTREQLEKKPLRILEIIY